jgi:hypothetical protein
MTRGRSPGLIGCGPYGVKIFTGMKNRIFRTGLSLGRKHNLDSTWDFKKEFGREESEKSAENE